jgi:hypothetical protein
MGTKAGLRQEATTDKGVLFWTASDDATNRSRECYLGRMLLLLAEAGIATFWRLAVLPVEGGFATLGVRRCCRRFWALLL